MTQEELTRYLVKARLLGCEVVDLYIDKIQELEQVPVYLVHNSSDTYKLVISDSLRELSFDPFGTNTQVNNCKLISKTIGEIRDKLNISTYSVANLEVLGGNNLETISYLFGGMGKFKIDTDKLRVNLSKVKSLPYLFWRTANLDRETLRLIDTSNVVNLTGLFSSSYLPTFHTATYMKEDAFKSVEILDGAFEYVQNFKPYNITLDRPYTPELRSIHSMFRMSEIKALNVKLDAPKLEDARRMFEQAKIGRLLLDIGDLVPLLERKGYATQGMFWETDITDEVVISISAEHEKENIDLYKKLLHEVDCKKYFKLKRNNRCYNINDL